MVGETYFLTQYLPRYSSSKMEKISLMQKKMLWWPENLCTNLIVYFEIINVMKLNTNLFHRRGYMEAFEGAHFYEKFLKSFVRSCSAIDRNWRKMTAIFFSWAELWASKKIFLNFLHFEKFVPFLNCSVGVGPKNKFNYQKLKEI